MPESISHFLKHVQIKPVREGQSEADVYRCYDLKTGRGISDICFLRRQKEKYYVQTNYYTDPCRLARLAAEGIKMLVQMDISDCPADGQVAGKINIVRMPFLCSGNIWGSGK